MMWGVYLVAELIITFNYPLFALTFIVISIYEANYHMSMMYLIYQD